MGTAYEMKGKMKKALAKFLDLDVPEKTSLPERPERPERVQQPDQLADSFGALRLTVENDAGPSFVGGFRPHATTSPGRLPQPPAVQMPVPYAPQTQQSLTMHYALTPPRPDLPGRPISAPDIKHSDIFSSPGPSSSPSPAKAPKRQRAASTPPSPTTAKDSKDCLRCSGMTKAGNRCTRLIKGGTALQRMYPPDDKDEIKVFCHQHKPDILAETGFYAQDRHWVNFDDYIPPYLHLDTQAALREQMARRRSPGDEEGYIYCYEIRQPNPTPSSPILLKVGRATNLNRRLNQWGKQCNSKEQVLRGFFPMEEGEDASLLKACVKSDAKGVWCHRLERLIHLELADLAVHKPYLQPGWKNFKKGKGRGDTQHKYFKSLPQSLTPSTPGKKAASPGKGRARKASDTSSISSGSSSLSNARAFVSNGLGNYNVGQPCSDCGSVHKEIFAFGRFPAGPYQSREWDALVKQVIEGWGRFVEEYV